MNGTALYFWFGMAALLVVAVVLGRWHAEDMARRIADTYGVRAEGDRGHDPVRSQVSWRDVEPPDAEFPDEAERIPA